VRVYSELVNTGGIQRPACMWWVGERACRVLGLRTVPLHHTRHDTGRGCKSAVRPSTDYSRVMAYGALFAALSR
jgi:hypothetical protein